MKSHALVVSIPHILLNEVARRKQNLFYLGILPHFLPGRGHDQPVMLSGQCGPVLDLLAFKGDPGDPHLRKVISVPYSALKHLRLRKNSNSANSNPNWVLIRYGGATKARDEV